MSEDARALYAVPDLRGCPQPARWCDLCNEWTDHFADSHKVDELASDVEVKSALAEARSKLKGT